jgi:hypothetical protein
MGFFDDILGRTSADASRRAAADTYGKQQAAIGELKSYGDTYADRFEDLAGGYDPYVQTGAAGNSALMRLVQDPNSLRSLPGYQFAQDEGIQALDRSAASRGRLNSGRQSKDLQRFGTGLADQTYGSQFARLLGLSGQGMGAVGAQNSTIGQGLQGQLGTRQSAFGGGMQSAGTIGQGDIAAAQAQQSALTNLMSLASNGIGQAVGAGFNPLSAIGGARSSSFGSPGANSGPSMGGAGAGYDPYGRPFNWG